MSFPSVLDQGGTRIMAGMIPSKYDSVICSYDSNGNMLTATFSLGSLQLCTITMTYDMYGNMVSATVAP
jgi:hypothetical protein